jgi:hypothetical protein
MKAAQPRDSAPAPLARATFIPVLKSDLVAALGEAGLDRDSAASFQTLCAFLGSYFHHELYAELTELKNLYAWLGASGARPVRRQPVDRQAAYRKLAATFEHVMSQGNFVELSAEEMRELEGDHPVLNVKARTPMEAYETVRIFCRGRRTRMVEEPATWTRKARTSAVDVFDDVIVFVRFKEEWAIPRRGLARKQEAHRPAPGSVLIKSFRSISRPELPMLLPEIQVVMSRKDAILLGAPALLGGVPVMLNIVPALSVLLVVIGAYLGFQGEVTQDKLMKAVAALSVLVGAGAFVFRQYSNYSNRKLKYQKRLSDNIYFKNINNDVGVFETLISAAEEQETKEVILAYHALLTGGPAAKPEDLDRRIEAWLKAAFDIDVDFEVADALAKLRRLGFLGQNDGQIAVVPLGEALSRLDTLWDRLYDFPKPVRSSAAA